MKKFAKTDNHQKSFSQSSQNDDPKTKSYLSKSQTTQLLKAKSQIHDLLGMLPSSLNFNHNEEAQISKLNVNEMKRERSEAS